MICVSISNSNLENCLKQLKDEDLAEIRLDLTGFTDNDIEQVFGLKIKTIATMRPEGYTQNVRLQRLKKAISSGAAFIDIEYEAEVKYRKELMAFAKENGCEVIISYHNYELTPSRDELERIVHDCYLYGADIAKVATMVNDKRDLSNLLGLYSSSHRLVSIGMGEKGILTRILAPLMGAEFTFAAPDHGTETAPGQLNKSDLIKSIQQFEKL